MNRFFKLSIIISGFLLLISCVEKNPSRDEIPLIKNLLGQFEQAVREKNSAGIDSLIIAEAYELGYHSTKILSDIYGSGDTGDAGNIGPPDDIGSDIDTNEFLKFGTREFFYTKDIGVVNCFIVSDTGDAGSTGNAGSIGRPVEITVVKKYGQWYIKRFDLK